jgi:hypothetical protein
MEPKSGKDQREDIWKATLVDYGKFQHTTHLENITMIRPPLTSTI